MPDAVQEPYVRDAYQALESGDLPLVETLCRAGLAVHPRNGDCFHLLGVVARRLGRGFEAMAFFREAIHRAPERAEFANNLAALLSSLGLHDEALAACDAALGLHPDFVYLHMNRGVALHALGREPDAAAAFRRATELDCGQVQAHFGLGCALEASGQWEQAEAAFRATLALSANHAEAYNLLGRVLSAQGRQDEAAQAFQQAVTANPGYAVAYNNLGSVLLKLDRAQDALVALLRSAELEPDNWQTQNNLSVVYQELAQTRAAIIHGRRAVALAPDNVDAHWCLSLQLLQDGQWQDGWTEYEWRRKLPDQNPLGDVPRWNGEPCGDRLLLISAEQGHGDTLQFLRYLPLVQQRCGNVVLRVQTALVGLVRANYAVPVIGYDEPVPTPALTIPLMSLPLVLDVLAPLATGPYLRPDAQLVDKWKALLGDRKGLRTGIAWRGSPTHKRDSFRSVGLEVLQPLLQLPGVDFVPLHPDLREDERAALERFSIPAMLPGTADFAHTAALVECLDLVISVDTSMIHLAGALGRETWLSLPFSCDWRWGSTGEDSVWYSGLRLFRQSQAGDWSAVIAGQVAALRERL
ncbi:MAG: tetratricopeptide repeat protein [Rhodospirillaceae bacterium]|nr:tetratricopeptide repeat protein [Rhodospirillales bacterium]